MIDYHEKTKHSYFSVRNNPNYLDWSKEPSKYKIYPDSYEKTTLNLQNPWHKVIILAAAHSAKKIYPSNITIYLRMNPSAGALYPNELYFQARGVDGLRDGIYHYEVYSNRAVLLKEIDENSGLEGYFNEKYAIKGLLFFVSAIYYRSSWKYKNRAFRYCLLDSGHLLGAIEQSALLLPHASYVKYNFDKEALNKAFGFENREFFLASARVGVPIKDSKVKRVELNLEYVEASGSFEQNTIIEAAYKESLKSIEPKSSKRSPKFSYNKELLEKSIITRRSTREFFSKYISKAQFEYILDYISQPVISDCDEDVNIYCVVNRVEGLKCGLYKNSSLIKEGDFSQKIGYLALEQYNLAQNSSVTFILSSNSKNYQAAYIKAGIIGQRVYISAKNLDIGCSGIGAYYDDEVNEFIESSDMIFYLLSIGN